MSEKLLPCPFCGSDQLVVKPNAFDGLLRVQCEGCWATSVTSNQKKVAVAAWNTRVGVAPETRGLDKEELEKVLDLFNAENLRYMVRVGGLHSWLDQRKAELRALVPSRTAATTDGPAPVPWEKHEAEMLKIIDEREAAQSCIDEIYSSVMGRRPEWSNGFGFTEAVDEITETIASFIAGKIPDAVPTTSPEPDAVEALKLAARDVLDYGWEWRPTMHPRNRRLRKMADALAGLAQPRKEGDTHD